MSAAHHRLKNRLTENLGGVDIDHLVIASLDQRAGNHRKQGAILALFLALVLAWVGGARTGTQLGTLSAGQDHGLVGAAAERAQADSLPTGKRGEAASEASESEGGRETEDDSEFAPSWIDRSSLEAPWFTARASQAGDGTSARRAWLSLGSTGARGPPVC